jgi:dienelactone hydrolase
MGEIASWGYFVVADGTPGSANACAGGQDGKAFLDYITWAIAENDKSCSAYYQSLETTKIAADGFSCGGLMAENASGDPRFSAIGITSSGLMGANASLYSKIHTPFKIMNGGSSDIAYENGLNDYNAISAKGIPIVYYSKTSAGHGGDLGQARGDFNKVNLAWLNWQLKGDTGATGKGYLVGSTCTICTNAGWTFKSANLP